MNQTKYTFEDFCKIVADLRGEHGCPWDKAQTHESLERYLLEESYEAVEGIRRFAATGDADNLCEELGDVLFQVVLHAQIAREEGIFTLDDVVQEVSEKMIRRHPHVFASEDPAEVISWEEIKKKEKEQRQKQGKEPEEIPAAFPALIRAVKVQKKLEAGEQGTVSQAAVRAEKLLEALSGDPVSSEDAEKCVGSLLYEICRLAGAAGVYPEKALADTVERHIHEARQGAGEVKPEPHSN